MAEETFYLLEVLEMYAILLGILLKSKCKSTSTDVQYSWYTTIEPLSFGHHYG